MAEVAALVQDQDLRARLETLHARLVHSRLPTDQRPRPVLTPREVDVLTQVALGLTNAEAAAQLGLLPNTAKSYLKTAMRKLEAKNRVQAITAAREAGLIC